MTAGRPREFDYDKALDQAMHVFWRKGFEGTSLPDLTAAMGINRPSLYAAFGNKEELFRKALDRYAQNAAEHLRELLDVPTVQEAVERFLLGSADSLTCKENPRGCLAVQGALVGSEESKAACNEARAHRNALCKILQERFEQGIKDGDLPKKTDTLELARFYTTVLNGMSVQSVNGLGCAEMKAIAKRAIAALPVSK